jgi:hypothetical protein
VADLSFTNVEFAHTAVENAVTEGQSGQVRKIFAFFRESVLS